MTAPALEHVEGLKHYLVCPECGALVFEHDSRTSPATYAEAVVCADCGWQWEPEDESEVGE